jgi:hypothetical protein
MNFEYITKPEGPHEKAVVKAGYKWVRTNEIAATRKSESTGREKRFDPSHLDRLVKHSHNGPNTHLIVEGDLVFRQQLWKPYTIETDPRGRHEFPVPRERAYRATSEAGGRFVEGHRSLSPSTAERFMARGTLRAVPRRLAALSARMARLNLNSVQVQDMNWPRGWKWPRQDRIREWLRKASFSPRGRPSLLGRSGRFTFKWGDETSDPVEIRARELIVLWFRKEWDTDNLPKLYDVETRGLYRKGRK